MGKEQKDRDYVYPVEISNSDFDKLVRKGTVEEAIEYLKERVESLNKVEDPDAYLRDNLKRAIYNLQYERQKYVLAHYYLYGKSLSDIKVELGITNQKVCSIFDNGNKNLIDVIRLMLIFK